MDNAGANGAMMEIARVLSQHRDKLRRSLRIAFWSGHSHGRYPGSTWYADNFWEDLHRNCIAHLNIDLIGGKGASDLTATMTMAETWAFAADVIMELTGQELKQRRMGRMGDQSFFGCGVPSMFNVLSQQPPEPGRTGFAEPWEEWGSWWHAPEDTMDILDRDTLLRDTRVYLLSILRLCTLTLLPFDYSAAADEFLAALNDWQGRAGDAFDLGRCLDEAREFKDEATLFNDAVRSSPTEQPEIAGLVNRTLMKLGRVLNPVSYTSTGQFDQDLATGSRPVPVLQAVRDLVSHKPGSDEFRFLHTRLVRESNKVYHALTEATELVQEARRQLKG
jgi:hypothetical protein